MTVSGPAAAVDAVAAAVTAAGAKATRLRVSHAFHSALMEPVLGEFTAVLQQVTYRAPALAGASNVTGELAGAEQWCDPGYWAGHVRRPVRFADGLGALRDAGAGMFLELGPDGALTALAADGPGVAVGRAAPRPR